MWKNEFHASWLGWLVIGLVTVILNVMLHFIDSGYIAAFFMFLFSGRYLPAWAIYVLTGNSHDVPGRVSQHTAFMSLNR